MRRLFLCMAALLIMVGAAHAEAKPRLIAFNQNGKIVLVQSDGSGQRTLVEKDVDDGNAPYWSPDGTQIAFLSYSRGQTGFQINLSVIRVDGRDLHTLPDGDGPNPPRPVELPPEEPLSRVQNPVWSPDSQQIFFEWAAWGRSAYFVVNADGSELHRMPHGNLLRSAQAVWSRDGQQIVYLTQENQEQSIYIASADGRTSHMVLPDASRVSGFDWSPDEKQFVFTFHEREALKSHIYRVDADGNNRIRLADGDDNYYSASWSPDGQTILTLRSHGSVRESNVYIMKLDGSDGRYLTQAGHVQNASWVGNTSKILYQFKKDNRLISSLLDFDGNVIPLPEHAANAFQLYGSPDWKQLAFIDSDEKNQRGLYVVNIDGSGLKRIADGVGRPAWQPGP